MQETTKSKLSVEPRVQGGLLRQWKAVCGCRVGAKHALYGVHYLCPGIALAMLSGCILVSDAKYDADKAMWLAKAEASKAWAVSANKPLATFTTKGGETFTVMNPHIAQPMPVTGEPNAFVQGADVVLNSWVAKLFGGGYLADKILGNMQGNYSASGGGAMTVTQDSNNSVDVTTRHTEGDSSGIAQEAHAGSDNITEDNRSDYDNATETPTVVNQPTPLVVNPVIVRPEVVRPEVVHPVVVTQPATTN